MIDEADHRLGTGKLCYQRDRYVRAEGYLNYEYIYRTCSDALAYSAKDVKCKGSRRVNNSNSTLIVRLLALPREAGHSRVKIRHDTG